jgi:hypothetical protein
MLQRALAMILVAFAFCGVLGGAFAQEKEPAKEGEVLDKIVRMYLENATQADTVEKNAMLCVRADTPFVGIAKGGGADKVYSKKIGDIVKEQKQELQTLARKVPCTVDSVKIDFTDESLATARVTYSNEFIKLRGVFTFSSEGGSWKIASIVMESRFPTKNNANLLLQQTDRANDGPL